MGVPSNNRRSPVEDLTAAGYSTLTTQEEQDVLGRGVWQDKTWRVVFKRTLVNSDNADVQFKSFNSYGYRCMEWRVTASVMVKRVFQTGFFFVCL